jgi:hypothetical protein
MKGDELSGRLEMRGMLTRDRRSWKSLILLAALATTGCSEELGPEHWQTTTVKGRVHEDNQPVGGGWIEFVPVDGTVGNFRVGPIKRDGTFEVDRVPVGRHVVGLAYAPIRMPNGKLFYTYTTPVRRNIPPGPETHLDLNLVEEMARHRASQAQARTN